jgi:hypothetical protein
MQRQAVVSRHEAAGEALAHESLGGGAAASLLKVSVPSGSVKKH